MQYSLPSLLVLAFALTSLACKKKEEDEPKKDLDNEQVSAVMTMFSSGQNGVNGQAGSSLALHEEYQLGDVYTSEFEETVECGLGGTTDIASTMSTEFTNIDPMTISMTYELTQTMKACKEKGSDGKDYAVTGELKTEDATASYVITTSETASTFEGVTSMNIIGKLDVDGDELEVRGCEIALETKTTVSGPSDNLNYVYTWTGTICGEDTEGEMEYSGDDEDGTEEGA